MNQTTDPVSIRQLLEQATRLLNTDTARLDAEVLLGHVLQKSRSHFHAWPEKQVPATSALLNCCNADLKVNRLPT